MNQSNESSYQGMSEESLDSNNTIKSKSIQESLMIEDKTKSLIYFKSKSNSWIFIALLSGVWAGIGNMFVGKASSSGFYSSMLVAIGDMAASILYLAISSLHWNMSIIESHKPIFSKYWTLKQSAVTVLWILLDSAAAVGGGHIVIMVFEYSFYANINQGIITTLFSFTSVYLWILGWMFFHERMGLHHMLGILSLVMWAVFYGFSHQSSSMHTENEVSPMVPILLALACSGYFTLRSLFLKAFWMKFNFNSLDFMALSYLAWGIVLSSLSVISFVSYGIDLELFKDWFLGGILHGSSMMLLYNAISVGYSGPAAALSSIQTPIQAFLSFMILDQIPNSFQLIGLGFGLFGSLLICMGGSIIEILSKVICKSKH